MNTSRHIAHSGQAPALCLVLCLGTLHAAPAEPQSGAADAQTAAPKGGFFSSLKQAFNQDFDHEVVRGHFDVGSAPDVHRYYCLVDPKTGKREPNGVAGQPFVRPDGMTGIKSAAVSFDSCASAEQQGTLVTDGYVVTGAAGAPIPPRAAPAAPIAPTAPNAPLAPIAPPASAAPIAPIAPAAPTVSAAPVESAAAPVASGSAQAEIMAVFSRFITAQNTHDRAGVAATLLASEFAWAPDDGAAGWGRDEAMAAFQEEWQGTWKLQPQLSGLRIASVAADTAVLITPLMLTEGDPGKPPSTVPVRWSGVFVRTSAGWRLASIFVTPLRDRRAPRIH